MQAVKEDAFPYEREVASVGLGPVGKQLQGGQTESGIVYSICETEITVLVPKRY